MAPTDTLENENHPPTPPEESLPPYTRNEDASNKEAASSPGKVVIIGGLGEVALGLTQLLANNSFNVTSVISKDTQAPEIKAKGATPCVLSLKDDAAPKALTALFKKTQLIYFVAGEGDKAKPESVHKAVHKDALMVFDAVEAMKGEKPHVILVSSIDTRNPDKLETFPPHYDQADKKLSAKNHDTMKPYFKWRYETDKNLVARTAFHWTILRPGELIDGPGKGRVEIGRTHLKDVTRDDVVTTLYQLASKPKPDAIALDIIGGKTPITEALDLALKNLKGKKDFLA